MHGFKGEEFDAVILAVPATSSEATHVFDDWETGQNSEQRRVLYLGASRARKLLVLVVPTTRHTQLVGILSKASVPHAVTEVKATKAQRSTAAKRAQA